MVIVWWVLAVLRKKQKTRWRIYKWSRHSSWGLICNKCWYTWNQHMCQSTCAFSIIGACLTFFAVFCILRRSRAMGGKREKWNRKSSFGSILNQCHYSWNLLLEESQVELLESRPKMSDVINFSFFILKTAWIHFKSFDSSLSYCLYEWREDKWLKLRYGHFTRDVYRDATVTITVVPVNGFYR